MVQFAHVISFPDNILTSDHVMYVCSRDYVASLLYLVNIIYVSFYRVDKACLVTQLAHALYPILIEDAIIVFPRHSHVYCFVIVIY